MPDLDDFGLSAILFIVVIAVLSAALLPPAINAATSADFDERTDTSTLTVGDTANLTDVDTTATLDSTTETSATYTLANGGTDTATITEGDNSTLTVDGTDYTINVMEVDNSSETATVSITYQTGDSGAASSVWGMVPLFMVLAVALLFISSALDGNNDL